MLPAKEMPAPPGSEGLPGQGQPGTTGPKGPPGETAPVDEATVASLIEQMQQQSEAAESVPLKSTPSDYTKSFVRAAIGRYESDGLEATLAYYNTQESIDGQWYMFIMDQENMMLAHAANPDLVGRPISAAVGPNGYPAGRRSQRLRTKTELGSTTLSSTPPPALGRRSTLG